MSVFLGAAPVKRPEGKATEAKAAEAQPAQARKGGSRPTKAELLKQAEELGIEVPAKATNPEITQLIKEAMG